MIVRQMMKLAGLPASIPVEAFPSATGSVRYATNHRRRTTRLCLVTAVVIVLSGWLSSRANAQAPAVLVKDINTSPFSSNPHGYFTIGSTTFFMASDSLHGKELWKTDGTAAGTMLVKDINPARLMPI